MTRHFFGIEGREDTQLKTLCVCVVTAYIENTQMVYGLLFMVYGTSELRNEESCHYQRRKIILNRNITPIITDHPVAIFMFLRLG